MLDLNAAIQAARSSSHPSLELPGGTLGTRSPSESWPRGPPTHTRSFLEMAFLGHPRPAGLLHAPFHQADLPRGSALLAACLAQEGPTLLAPLRVLRRDLPGAGV